MTSEAVRNRLLNLDDLPTLPEVVARVMQAVEDDQSSARDLSEILEMDHAISARVLRMANSAYFGFRGRIETIRRAIVVVGFNAIRDIAVSTTVFDALNDQIAHAIDPRDFWMHSLGAAKAAKMIVRKTGGVKAPDDCFTAGLLHDIGKFAMSLTLEEEFEEIIAEARASERSLVEVEREKLGLDHAAASAMVGKKWNFPPLLVETIGAQQSIEDYRGDAMKDVAAVALASELSWEAEFGAALETEPRWDRDRIHRILRLAPETVDELRVQLAELKAETLEFLELLVETKS